MAGARGDIAVAEQVALVDLRIVLGLASFIAQIARPAHEMRHRPHRPVAVERLDREPLRLEIARHLRPARPRPPGQIADRLLVAVDRPADEIVGAEIAQVDHEVGHHGGSIDEARRPRRLRERQRRRA